MRAGFNSPFRSYCFFSERLCLSPLLLPSAVQDISTNRKVVRARLTFHLPLYVLGRISLRNPIPPHINIHPLQSLLLPHLFLLALNYLLTTLHFLLLANPHILTRNRLSPRILPTTQSLTITDVHRLNIFFRDGAWCFFFFGCDWGRRGRG